MRARRDQQENDDRVRRLRNFGRPCRFSGSWASVHSFSAGTPTSAACWQPGAVRDRYDNRDCGLSTKLVDHPVDLVEFITGVKPGGLDWTLAMSPYSLRTMASHGTDLLQSLGIDRAHEVGPRWAA